MKSRGKKDKQDVGRNVASKVGVKGEMKCGRYGGYGNNRRTYKEPT